MEEEMAQNIVLTSEMSVWKVTAAQNYWMWSVMKYGG